jgi:hypothetical protein
MVNALIFIAADIWPNPCFTPVCSTPLYWRVVVSHSNPLFLIGIRIDAHIPYPPPTKIATRVQNKDWAIVSILLSFVVIGAVHFYWRLSTLPTFRMWLLRTVWYDWNPRSFSTDPPSHTAFHPTQGSSWGAGEGERCRRPGQQILRSGKAGGKVVIWNENDFLSLNFKLLK